MKWVLILAFLIWVDYAVAQPHDGGDHIGNGGGLAEQNISNAFLNLPSIYQLCLTTNTCLSQLSDRDILRKMANSLPREFQNPHALIFLSGHEHPEIFKIDNQMKVAVTGSHVGDSIYFNLDLIYTVDLDGKIVPMGMPQAISILTHELGHHQGIRDHQYLDLLGAHVQMFSMQAMTTLVVDNYLDYGSERSPELVLTAVHRRLQSGSELDGAESLLLFADEESVVDLTPWLNQALKFCPQTATHQKSKMLGYRLFNMHWAGRGIVDGTTEKRIYTVKADVEMFCEAPESPSYPVRFDTEHEMTIDLPVYFEFRQVGSTESHFIWKLQQKLIAMKLSPANF